MCDEAALGRTELMLLLAAYMTKQDYVFIHLDTCDYPDSRLNKWQWEEAQNGVQTSHSHRYATERY